MAKFRSSSSSSGKKKMIKLNTLAEKLQKSLSLVRPRSNDVKEGHFAVMAMDGTRFVVPLSCLERPTFRRLLEMAAEEYGFDHAGALTLPCRPADIQRILADQNHWSDSGTDGESSWPRYYRNKNAMVQSY